MNRMTCRLLLGSSLALASTLASAALTPLSDAELSEQHGEGLELLAASQLLQGDGVGGLGRAAQDLLRNLEQQHSQGTQRLAATDLQVLAGKTPTLSLAGAESSLALLPFLLPALSLPALDTLSKMLPAKKAAPPEGP